MYSTHAAAIVDAIVETIVGFLSFHGNVEFIVDPWTTFFDEIPFIVDSWIECDVISAFREREIPKLATNNELVNVGALAI